MRTLIAGATAGDEVVFDSTVSAITLATPINIGINLTVSGRGIGVLTISGGTLSSIFNVTSGTVVIRRMTIIDANALVGSAVNVTGGTVTVQHCAFSNCVCTNANFDGGTIRNSGGTLSVLDCTITNCSNIGASGACGGIWLTIGTATIERVSITGCMSGRATAIGIAGSHGSAVIRYCTISGNTSTSTRASIYSQIGTGHVLENCTITNNTAATGQGGAYLLTGTWTVRNNTLTGNSHSDMQSNAAVTFSNNAIGLAAGPGASAGFNVIGNVGTSTGWIGTDLVGTAATPINLNLGPLANNGGPMQTMLPQGGSPLLNFVTGAGPDFDARGLTRTGNMDAGAVEVDGLGPLSAAPTSVPVGANFTLSGQQMTAVTAVTIAGVPAILGAATATTLQVTVGALTVEGPHRIVEVTTAGKTQGFLNIEVTAVPPEIEVFDAAVGGVSLVDPAAKPGINAGATGITLTFRIENQISAPGILAMPVNPVSAVVSTGSGTVNVSIVQPANLTLSPGNSTTFAITITATPTAVGGAYTVDLELTSNDFDENPFNIAISGNAKYNLAPRANDGAGTPAFAGTADTGPFSFSANPGTPIASQIVLDDGNADDVQVTSLTPPGAQAGVTPSISTSAFAPTVTVDFVGSIDSATPPGIYIWTIDVTDDDTPALTRLVDVSITVNNVAPVGVNQPVAPTTGSGIDQFNGYSRNFVQSALVAATDLFTVTDANTGQNVTIVSQNRTGPAGPTTFPFDGMFAISGGAGAFTVSVSAPAPLAATDVGLHEYTLVLQDAAGGAQITVFVTLTVEAQTPPTFTPALGINVAQGTMVTNAVVGTVADGQDPVSALQVAITSTPAGITVSALSVNPSNGVVTVTLAASAAAAPGAQSVGFSVTDSRSAVDTDDYDFTVLANVGPTITPASGVSVIRGATSAGHEIATVADADRAPGLLTVTVLATPTGLTVNNIVNTAGTVTADIATSSLITLGLHDVTLQVSDIHGITSQTLLQVNVGVVSQKPKTPEGSGCAAGTRSPLLAVGLLPILVAFLRRRPARQG